MIRVQKILGHASAHHTAPHITVSILGHTGRSVEAISKEKLEFHHIFIGVYMPSNFLVVDALVGVAIADRKPEVCAKPLELDEFENRVFGLELGVLVDGANARGANTVAYRAKRPPSHLGH